MLSLSKIIKYLESAFTSYTQFINSDKIETLTQDVVKEATSSDTGEIHQVIKEKIFRNLPPKIGYFNETTVPISASYNMSYQFVNEELTLPRILTDFEGREMVYMLASSEAGGERNIYQAYRMDTSSSFTTENTPMQVPILKGKSFDSMRTLTSQYIILHIRGGEWVLIFTNGSGNPSAWTSYESVQKIFDKCGGYTLHNILRFETSAGVRYLVLLTDGQHTLLRVFSDTFDQLYEDMVYNYEQDLKNSDHPDYKVYEANHWSFSTQMAYVESQKILLLQDNAQTRWNNEKGLYVQQWQHTIWNGISFEPDDLLTTNYFSKTSWIVDPKYLEDVCHYFNGDIEANPEWGNCILSYDSLTDRIYKSFTSRDWYVTQVGVQKVDRLKELIQKNRRNGDMVESFNFAYPDTSPWAKRLGNPWIYYDAVYLNGDSIKYGSGNHICVVPEKGRTKGVLAVKANSWSLTNPPQNNGELVCQKDDTKPQGCQWYRWSNQNGKVHWYEINLGARADQNGETHNDLLVTGNDIDSYPIIDNAKLYFYSNGNTALGRCQVAYCLPPGTALNTDKTAAASDEEYGYFIISKPDGSQQKIKITDMTGYDCKTFMHRGIVPSDKLTWCDRSFSNSFVDTDGTFYFCMRYWWGYDQYSFPICHVDLTNKTLNLTDSITPWYNNKSLGYSKTWGYYSTYYGGSYASAIIHSGKDPYWGGQQEYTRDEVFGQAKYYSSTFNTTGSVGLVTYIQNTPVFLGGYFSIVPAQEIPLKPNCDNYIYFYRAPGDTEKIQVEVTQAPRTDVDGFYRIYTTKVTTDSAGAISQEYNEIKNYGK